MAFKPPDTPPSHTGTLWLNADKTIGGLISDVFNEPIHILATKEGAQYRVVGWRGTPPEFRRIALADDAREDGLPDDAPHTKCGKCEGRLYWRAAMTAGLWRCATCEPADPLVYLDGVCVGAK